MEEACWPPGNNHGELKTNVQIASVKLRGEESPGIFIGRGGEGVSKAREKTMCDFDVVEGGDGMTNRRQGKKLMRLANQVYPQRVCGEPPRGR